MEKFIIDRFEGIYAVCEREDKSPVNIVKSTLPPGCREGDCLITDADGTIRIDSTQTNNRQERIREKMKRLFE